MSAKLKTVTIATLILAAAALFIVVLEENLREPLQGPEETQTSKAENGGENTFPEITTSSSPEETPLAPAVTVPTRESMPPAEGGMIELVGRVIDDQGKPLEGAMVQQANRKFWSGTSRFAKNFRWSDSEILTGPGGAFSILIPRDDVASTWINIQISGYELFEAVPAINAVPGRDGTLDLGNIAIFPALAIRGRVIDEEGNPVPDCRVSALGSPWLEGDRFIEKTDEEGRFRQVFPNIEWGTDHLVKAFKDGCGVGWSPCPEPVSGEKAPEVTITLHPCGAISGRLLNGDGSVAGGMRLSANSTFPRMKMDLNVRTNEEGHFRFYPTPEGTYALRAYPPGYFDEKDGWGVVLDKGVAAGREGLEFRLPPMARLELYFTDDSGNPVAGEAPSVSLWRSRDDPLYRRLGSSTGFNLGNVLQLESGSYRIPNVSPGIYRIGCYFDEYDYHVFEDVTVPAKMETVRLEAALIKKPMILGRVFQPDGRPAKGIKLVCSQSHPYPDQSSREVPFTPYGLRIASGRMTDPKTEVTDEEGRFRFHVFPNWDSKNNFFHVQVFRENRVVLAESPIELTRESPQKVLTFTLPEGRRCTGAIEGLIRDAKGNALGNALVVVWDGKDLFYRTRSDDEGQYSFTTMPDGRYIVDGKALTSSLKRTTPIGNRKSLRKGFEDLETLDPYNAVITNGDTARCDLIVQDPWNGSISGSLVWASRSAPLDFEADLYAVGDKGGQKRYDEDYERPTAGDLFSFIWRAIRDDNPRKDGFCFNDLTAGRYRISVAGKGYDSEGNYFRCPMTSAEVVLEPSEQRELTLDLKIASLQGRVLDQETGKPVAGARIGMSLEPPAWWHQQGLWFTTRSDGIFECATVPAGTYRIRIMHDDHAEIRDRRLELFSNEQKRDLEFFLEPPNTLEGLLDRKNKTGEKIRYHIRLEVEKWGDRHVYCELSDDDRFIMKNLPAGPVKVIVRGPKKYEFARSVILPLPEGEKLVIEVP